MSTPPVWLPGSGYITSDGRYYPEARVRAVLLHVADWWNALTDAERAAVSEISYWAALDHEIDAAVQGEQS